MKFYILTLFPQMIREGLAHSIIARGQDKGLIEVYPIDIREFSKDKHRKVDDYTYGGGSGMLMQAQPIYDAYQSIKDELPSNTPVVYLTPQGRQFSQSVAKTYAKVEAMVLLCGHYEGIDERVLELICTDYISIGDYVLTGGELPAMIMIDAISRLIPSVLSNEKSFEDESFEGLLLEYPQYTRPEEFEGIKVPEVLLSGHHQRIAEYRRQGSIERTKKRRPDLYARFLESLDDNCE